MTPWSTLLLLLWLVSVIGGYFIAKRKGRSAAAGILIPVVLGLIGLAIVACLPNKRKAAGQHRTGRSGRSRARKRVPVPDAGTVPAASPLRIPIAGCVPDAVPARPPGTVHVPVPNTVAIPIPVAVHKRAASFPIAGTVRVVSADARAVVTFGAVPAARSRRTPSNPAHIPRLTANAIIPPFQRLQFRFVGVPFDSTAAKSCSQV